MQPSPSGDSGRGELGADGTVSVAPDWTPDEAFACVRAAACRVLEVAPERVRAGTCLDDLGADSLALIEMAELMEDELAQRSPCRVRVDDVALVQARTFGDLADELSRALARTPGARTQHRAAAERGT